jgi:hypothetical protein
VSPVGPVSPATRKYASGGWTPSGSPTGWVLTVTPAAAEAGGSFRYANRRKALPVDDPDPERAAMEAARRARGQMRRFCAANRLNRLGTLTYRGEGCHDPLVLRQHVALFFRRLRLLLGVAALPYLWVAEWHKSGHGLHVHFAVGQFIKRTQIVRAWPHGFVHIKLLGDLPVGSGSLGEARAAAKYLAKYIAKGVDEVRVPGLHRYEVAQGFQPERVQVWGRTVDEATCEASTLIDGRQPSYVWSSADTEAWVGPPTVWMQWAA